MKSIRAAIYAAIVLHALRQSFRKLLSPGIQGPASLPRSGQWVCLDFQVMETGDGVVVPVYRLNDEGRVPDLRKAIDAIDALGCYGRRYGDIGFHGVYVENLDELDEQDKDNITWYPAGWPRSKIDRMVRAVMRFR